jgi:hypothetical protein
MPGAMPLPYMNQLEAVWSNFDRCMTSHHGTTTRFSQFVWLEWNGKPQLMDGVCDPLTLKWLLDRKRRTPSFVAGVMTAAVRQEIEHDASQQVGMNVMQQHGYAQQKLTQNGMQFAFEGRVDKDDTNPNDKFLRSIGDMVETTPPWYYYIIVSGVHRTTGLPTSHTLALDCPGRALFDSDAGIATFSTLSDLADAFCDWTISGYPELDLRLCTFKSFS